MGTINTTAQSGVLRMQLNVSTRVPTVVATFVPDRWTKFVYFNVEVASGSKQSNPL
jgi:hypothetical protein